MFLIEQVHSQNWPYGENYSILKSSSGEKLENDFLKFDTIIRKLKDLGSIIDKSDKVCDLLLLLSMPSKFDTLVDTWNSFRC